MELTWVPNTEKGQQKQKLMFLLKTKNNSSRRLHSQLFVANTLINHQKFVQKYTIVIVFLVFFYLYQNF